MGTTSQPIDRLQLLSSTAMLKTVETNRTSPAWMDNAESRKPSLTCARVSAPNLVAEAVREEASSASETPTTVATSTTSTTTSTNTSLQRPIPMKAHQAPVNTKEAIPRQASSISLSSRLGVPASNMLAPEVTPYPGHGTAPPPSARAFSPASYAGGPGLVIQHSPPRLYPMREPYRAVPSPPYLAVSMSEDREEPRYEALLRDNCRLLEQLRERDLLVSSLQAQVVHLERQIHELRQLPTGKISHIPINDMIRIMEEYGSEVSNQTLPKRRENIKKASIVRQFRRWNPEFFRYFVHVNGQWLPKLGKEGELQRRAERRRQLKEESQGSVKGNN